MWYITEDGCRVDATPFAHEVGDSQFRPDRGRLALYLSIIPVVEIPLHGRAELDDVLI